MLAIVLNGIYIAVLVGILYFFIHQRRKFKNRKGGGPFFFEDDCLVLNTGVPYPVPLTDIDRVELHYNRREIEERISYHMWVWVVRKDGRTRKIYYTGSTVSATPAVWKAQLESHGLSVRMVGD